MFNKKQDNRSWLKLAHTIMIGALFFAQLQLKFIEYAYGNDYGKTTFVNTAKQNDAKQKVVQRDNSHSSSYTKLNKRYPVSSLFIVSSAPIIIHHYHVSSSPKLIYQQPFLNNSYKHTFSLRGPPAFFC